MSQKTKRVSCSGSQSRETALHTYLGEQGTVLFDMAFSYGESKLLQGHCRNIRAINSIIVKLEEGLH